MPTSQRPAKSPEPSRPGVRRRRSQDKNTPEPPATAVTPVVQLAPLTVEETPTALSPSVPSPAACEGSVLRQREPLYLAVRLWGVNSLDQKTQWAECVFRVFLIFRPRGEALRVFPQPGEPRITSNDPGWTDELVESLPTLALMNGKETTDEKAKREFFRVDDAKQIVDGEERDLWFPETGGRNVGLVTYQIEANVQLDLQFHEFPYDRHQLLIKLFLPKKHKDKVYEFVCEDNLHVASERLIPVSLGGHGIFEVKPGVSKALVEWEVLGHRAMHEQAHKDQTEASLCLDIVRKPQFYEDKFIARPGVIASLAVLSTIFDVDAMSDRCGITLTLLLTLTGINYCSTEALPNLPYSTALDRYHDAAHAFVFACIAQNVFFFYFSRTCQNFARPDAAADATTAAEAATATPSEAAMDASDAAAAATTNGTATALLGGVAAEVAAEVATGVEGFWDYWCDAWHLEVAETAAMGVIFGAWLLWNVIFYRRHKRAPWRQQQPPKKEAKK